MDHDAVRRRTAGRCFICELRGGNPEFAHHVFYEDDLAMAFLNKYPAVYGHSLVAPREHRERVTADFLPEEYLALQRIVYDVGEALRQVVPTERLYILSLGSVQANSHVHWHIAPLPPGVPFEKQQFAALDRAGYVDLPQSEAAQLANRLHAALSPPR